MPGIGLSRRSRGHASMRLASGEASIGDASSDVTIGLLGIGKAYDDGMAAATAQFNAFRAAIAEQAHRGRRGAARAGGDGDHGFTIALGMGIFDLDAPGAGD